MRCGYGRSLAFSPWLRSSNRFLVFLEPLLSKDFSCVCFVYEVCKAPPVSPMTCFAMLGVVALAVFLPLHTTRQGNRASFSLHEGTAQAVLFTSFTSETKGNK